jgi:hypothetical protein
VSYILLRRYAALKYLLCHRAISRSRNDLLRQMYHLMQRRDNLGQMLSEEDDEDDDDIHAFLDKHDLYKKCDILLLMWLLC